jgi:hypothetical protein
MNSWLYVMGQVHGPSSLTAGLGCTAVILHDLWKLTSVMQECKKMFCEVIQPGFSSWEGSSYSLTCWSTKEVVQLFMVVVGAGGGGGGGGKFISLGGSFPCTPPLSGLIPEYSGLQVGWQRPMSVPLFKLCMSMWL